MRSATPAAPRASISVDGHHGEPELAVVDEVSGAVQRTARADVHAGRGVEQALLGRAPERRAVGVGRAEVAVPRVEVRVEVHHRHRLRRRDGTQQRKRDGVVAAEHQQAGGALAQVARGALDAADRLVDRERVDRHVAGVGDLLDGERRQVRRGVVGPQQLGRGPDRGRPEPRTRTVGDSRVERDADHRDVGAVDLVDARQLGEGRWAREPWHLAVVRLPDVVARHHPRQWLSHVASPP